MSIRYIQTNYGKLDCYNVLRFLLDLTVYDLEDVKPYEEGHTYKKGDFIYLKENGIHKIYRCKVDVSSNTFIPDEWEHAMDTYDKEIKDVCNFEIREEVIIVDKDNIDNIIIPNYKPGSTVIIYNGKEVYIQGKDFIVDENGKITFIPPDLIQEGDRLIIEIKETTGLPDRLVLLSSNSLNYEVGIIGEDMYIIQTDLKHSKPEVFIKDIVTGENYRIYMIDEDVYYEITSIYASQTEIKVLDEDENEYIIEMIDGELMFSIKE